MSFWNRIIDTISGTENRLSHSRNESADSSRYGFVDVEVGLHDKKIHDIGAIRWDGAVYHSANKQGLMTFIKKVAFI